MIKFLSFITIGMLFFSCTEPPKELPKIDAKQLKENLIEMNKRALNKEATQIDAYVKKHQLKTSQTSTGLRYMIYKDIEGKNVEENQQVLVRYKVSLLNGTECYNTLNKPEYFTVGKDNVESGLHEGIQYLSAGDKAIIIIPSHLAHGLAGDFKKIPRKSTIVYDIELMNVK